MACRVQSERDAFWNEFVSDEQKRALQSFREVLDANNLLIDGHRDDVTLCRFLKARKWDGEKALVMWRDMISWRSLHATEPLHPPASDTFLCKCDSNALQIKQFYPHFFHKTDRLGRPVHYELLGELDLPSILKLASVERLIRLHYLGWERTKSMIFPACSVAAGREVFSCVTVLDLKGLKMASFSKETREFVAAIASIDQVHARTRALTVGSGMQRYFPEHLGQMYIVNAPFVFKAMWQVVSPWLEARTQVKIQVISSEKAATEALLAAIGPENLIKRLGGRSEADPLADLGEGPWLDEGIQQRAARSQFKYKDSTLSSTVSDDTAVDVAVP